MTLWEMDAAIAQHLGWKNVHVYEDDTGPPIHCGTPPGPASYDTKIPRYSEDLNTMAVVEKLLRNSNIWVIYCNTLAMLCGGTREDDGGLFVSHAEAIDAPAPKRAEAALRTLGKWKETP